jgi:hypothetical protein
MGLGLSGIASADVISANRDYWVTPAGEAQMSFADDPIPDDFFFLGSDAFGGTVVFRGEPIPTVPSNAIGKADTIVERLASTSDLGIGASEMIPIQLVALSLVSIQPISVGDGGGGFVDYDVRVCLPSGAQQQGTMEITRTQQNGGTFLASVPVEPIFEFTEVGNPSNSVTLDCGSVANLCEGMVLTNAGTNHFVLVGPGRVDPGKIPVALPTGAFQFEADCGGTLVAGGAGGAFVPGAAPAGQDSAVCQENTEAEDALTNNKGRHDSYLNDPNDKNQNGIPDFCEEEPIPTLSQWGLVIFAVVLVGIGMKVFARRQRPLAA